MRTRVIVLAGAFAVLTLLWFRLGRGPVSVRAADPPRVAFLIRFGLDAKPDADYGGSIRPAPSRIAGWQLGPGEKVEGDRWQCSTRRESYWDTPYEKTMGPTSRREKGTAKGILVEYEAPGPAEIAVRTAQGEFTIRPETSLWWYPRTFLNGRAEVSAVPVMRSMNSGAAAEDYPSLFQSRDGTLWLAWQSYENDGDRILARRFSGGAWSAPEEVAPAGRDYFRTAVAGDGSGAVWIVWSAQKDGDFDLYGRSWMKGQWSPVHRLTQSSGPDIYHTLATGSDGRMHLAWQSARGGNFDVHWKSFDGRRWSNEARVSDSPANDWEPALATGPGGKVAIVWDSYAQGNYDVMLRELDGGKLGPARTLAGSGAMESRASAAYDGQGRLWLAWDEGDWNWGKDYGQGIEDNGRGLLVRRQTRVGVLAGGRLMEPGASIADAVPADLRQVFHQPKLVLDSSGNPVVFFRYRVNLPQRGGGEESSRAMWRAGFTRLTGSSWTPMIELAEGYGRIDSPLAAVQTGDGELQLVWTSDGRGWPSGTPTEQNLMTATLPGRISTQAPQLKAFDESKEGLKPSHAAEAEDVARARAYRARVGGRNYRIVRGDIHRHTDISWDGNRDGSLHDSYRYALDAVAFDFLGVCDHQAGNMIPYNWWMIQKAADLFALPGRFAPMYSYERSLPYPNGHRNVVFARRGQPVLAISEAERRGKEGAAKLYDYLQQFGGITSAHTSATGAGTDWRDSNEELEPVVEIYQGYRRNYEGPGTPRSPAAGEEAKFSAGYVWNAWAKGIKMGVQSSSDHVSTHISYAAIYVENVDRESILAAMKARRSYAATDNIVVDFRMGGRFMGESFAATGAQPMEVYARGTGPIARVEVIKNNKIIYTAPGTGAELRFTHTDRDAGSGESYYYIRVEQQDGQLAWSSPIWVQYR